MSTHNIGFYEDLTKIIFELSSNIIKYAPYFFCCHTYVLTKHLVISTDSFAYSINCTYLLNVCITPWANDINKNVKVFFLNVLICPKICNIDNQ